MSVFTVRVGGFYVDNQSQSPQQFGLTQIADDALLFASYEEAQGYRDQMQRHSAVLEEVWDQRLVTQGWYVLAKNGLYLAAIEGVHWADWSHSRLFDSTTEIDELKQRMCDVGVSPEEFVGASVHLRFASAPI